VATPGRSARLPTLLIRFDRGELRDELTVVRRAVLAVMHAAVTCRAERDHMVVVVRPAVRKSASVMRLEVRASCRSEERRPLLAALADSVGAPENVNLQVVAAPAGSLFARSSSTSTRRRSLPTALLGRLSRNSTIRGTL
jgi:hypothetical protein